MSADSPPAVLVVTHTFAPDQAADTWLVDDLVASLTALGAQVDVLVHDVVKPRPRGPQPGPDGARVFSVGPQNRSSGMMRPLQHALAGLRYRLHGPQLLRGDAYDLVIFFSPAFLSGFYPGYLRRTGRAMHAVYVLWDFFPVHQAEVGRLANSPVLPILKWVERRAMAVADTICVMSPANARFLSQYHRGLSSDVVIVPPWGGRADDGTATSSPQEGAATRFTLVFGGQLTVGRGVETLLEAAELLRDRHVDVQIVIAGTGPDEERLRRLAQHKNLPDLRFLGRVPRPRYLELLSQSQVGLAVTVPNVSIPSFPSKIVDYFRMGLPAILCLERTSDVGPMIASTGAALSVEAGDSSGLADAVAELRFEWEHAGLDSRRDAARRYYAEHLSSDVAARRILALARRPTAGRADVRPAN